jgi:hypothetical protein
VNFAQLLFPDFSMILIGYLVCRFTPLNRPVWTQVEQLVYFLFFPVLLFHSIVKSPLDIRGRQAIWWRQAGCWHSVASRWPIRYPMAGLARGLCGTAACRRSSSGV